MLKEKTTGIRYEPPTRTPDAELEPLKLIASKKRPVIMTMRRRGEKTFNDSGQRRDTSSNVRGPVNESDVFIALTGTNADTLLKNIQVLSVEQGKKEKIAIGLESLSSSSTRSSSNLAQLRSLNKLLSSRKKMEAVYLLIVVLAILCSYCFAVFLRIHLVLVMYNTSNVRNFSIMTYYLNMDQSMFAAAEILTVMYQFSRTFTNLTFLQTVNSTYYSVNGQSMPTPSSLASCSMPTISSKPTSTSSSTS